MNKKRTEKHFLLHTAEHLSGIFFVFLVAIGVGYVASAETSGGYSVTDTTPPTPPSEFVAQIATPSSINLHWKASTDNSGIVTGYIIYKVSSNAPSTPSTIQASATTSAIQYYTDSSGLTPGSTITYTVVAVDAAGNLSELSSSASVVMPNESSAGSTTDSTLTSTDTIRPTPPTLAVTGVSGTQINFSFTGASDNVGIAGYKLFKNGVFLATLSSNTTSYNDPTVQYGATYSFYAKAVDAAQNISEPSNTVSVTIPTNTTTSTITDPSSTTSIPVAFSATVAPITNCSGTRPMTEVFFGISAVTGGKFLLTSDGGINNAPFEWGKYAFPNGKYSWVAVPRTGFIVDSVNGSASGYFELKGQCITSTETVPTTTTTATTTYVWVAPPSATTPPPTTTVLPIITRPTLRIFVNNMPITRLEPVFDDEDVEFRVMVPHAKKVNFYALASNFAVPTLLGTGVIDDLLSTENAEAWTFVDNSSGAKEGAYKVFARILRLDGTLIETTPIPVVIKHQVPVSGTVETYSIRSNENGGVQIGSSTLTVDERTQILARVNSPSVCMSALECKVYCASHPEEKERCMQFVRVAAHFISGQDVPSLTDDISVERLTNMLNDPNKRAKDIPLLVEDHKDLRAYCADPSHAEICVRALLRNDLSTEEALLAKRTLLENARKEERKLLTDRTGARAYVDTDSDGVSDYDEVNIFQTDPSDADTDHDGFEDGKEIESHTNPNGNTATTSIDKENPPASEEVTMENPLFAGVTDAELLSVTGLVVTETELDAEGVMMIKKMKLSGRSLPNSYVTIFIFSEPIVVTIKTDASGAWVYTLDKNLPDGTHQIVSAITDGGGRILAKSKTLPFVKVASAVSVGSDAFAPSQQSPGFFSGASLYAFIAILIGLLGAAFSILGFISYRHREGDIPPPIA